MAASLSTGNALDLGISQAACDFPFSLGVWVLEETC